MHRVWDIRASDPEMVAGLSSELGIHEIVARVLLQRGIKGVEEGHRFLEPSLEALHDPNLMKGMPAAVERLSKALKSGERVCIWGDYDVDGATSTALLLLFFRHVGFEADFHIPSRLDEGYGLNAEGVAELARRGTRLLVTVDCGTSDAEEIRQALRAGMDVIVIDHHQVSAELPPALAMLNPHQPGCQFPTKDLAAVGVTFNLVMALRAALRAGGLFEEIEEPNLREYLDLVSLGTVADIVPLAGENRVITQFGLVELAAGRRPGVAALKEVAGILGGSVTVGQVAYRLAPRINAVGRLGKAGLAVELLTTGSYSRALALARELDRTNTERQAIEQEIFKQALEQAQELIAHGENRALVLAAEGWHAGVVGIVASRLVERFGCPVVQIAFEGENGRGSARGVEGVHLFEALQSCAEVLESFGGHRAAAGLTVRRDRLGAFRSAFYKALEKQLSGKTPIRTVRVDGEVQPSAWTAELMTQLARLAPHGLGNPEPLFVGRNLVVKSARAVGKEPPYHLKVTLLDGERPWDAIGFRMGDRSGEIRDRMDFVYTPEFNTWEGQTSIQLRLIDMRPSE